MSLTCDGNKRYGETRDALGPPAMIFVDFFNRFDREHARILDVGCGQGRDALFIARKGHSAVGVGISPNGIRDLRAAAENEKLPVPGVVADIAVCTPKGVFDVILIDRTLHMLSQPTRLPSLRQATRKRSLAGGERQSKPQTGCRQVEKPKVHRRPKTWDT